MLYVERSNRTENLLEGLAERLMSPRSAPLSPSCVVVQGQGMERWIAQAVAREYGVCANTEFLFPRNLLERVFTLSEAALDAPGPAANPAWQSDQLLWSIARRIAVSQDAPELAPLARQLESSDQGWRLVQLASQIANRFDDYITYRPAWVMRWSQPDERSGTRANSIDLGPDEAWQSWLFRGVLEDLGPGHVADRGMRFIERIEVGASEGLEATIRSSFPNGIEVFAVSTLPPLYLSVLDGLAQIVDIRLSVLSPSRHYWADLWTEVRDERASPVPNSVASLLVGLGRLGGDFQHSLEQVSGYVETEPDRFESTRLNGDASILQRLQSKMLDLDLDSAPEDSQRRGVASDDRSIQIHLCHGPKRELEAIEAALREAFDRDPTLVPEDVIVMAPEIDSLIPTIEAVFGGTGGAQKTGIGASPIPFRIADRGTLRRSPIAEAFVGLLNLLPGRAGRSEILDWVSLEPVRAKLGLDAEGVDRLSDWAIRAGVRFGFDEAHREALDLESARRHTWAGGIDRLVLGHALGATGAVVEGLSPEPLGPLSDPALLGAIGALERILSGARREMRRPRSVKGWSRWLLDLLDATLDHRDDNAHEHGMIRAATQRIAEAATEASFDLPIPFEAMRERFQQAIEASPPAQGFLSGGMTFCELVPLRAIPFKVIAIVGLSDSSFPRRRPAVSYDLVARHPQSGDRNSRSDDRYLFLEALLSAREQLILTVPGHDLRDGSELPPSVVISELLDTLDAAFEPEDRAAYPRVRDLLLVSHPIHHFSARYFEVGGDPRLAGLNLEAYEGAFARREALDLGGGATRKFLRPVDSPPPSRAAPEPFHLDLDDLIERVLRSTRVFARDRLGMRLPRPERAVSDFDPIEIDALDQYGLGDALLRDLSGEVDRGEAVARLLANARLPGGDPGRLAARSLEREVLSTLAIAQLRMGDAPLVEKAIDLHLDGVGSTGPARLSGTLRNVALNGLVRVDFARFAGRGELGFWIQHLAYCAQVDSSSSKEIESRFIARVQSASKRDRVSTFGYVENAREELEMLFEWALHAELAPLPFFPRASRVFASRFTEENAEPAWRDAHQKYYGGESGLFSLPESEEELEQIRVWEGSLPLEARDDLSGAYAFDSLALRFFDGFFAAREVFAK